LLNQASNLDPSPRQPSDLTPAEAEPRDPARARWMFVVGGAVLVAAALLVYRPTLGYEFVGWDDDKNIGLNPMVVLPRGLATIWTSLRGPAGLPNYPLMYTSFWLEYRLWGATPGPYHATNVVLHALNAVLVMLLLRRLGLSRVAAWLTAVLFALHPLQAESVAWVTERKNVLSASFYLIAFLLYARYRAAPRPATYALALATYVAALLSKTASVTLVPSLFLADCLVFCDARRLTQQTAAQSIRRLWPFAVIGVAVSLLLVAVEDRPSSPLPWASRAPVAALATWFYLGKLAVPTDLIPIYPRWSIDAAAPSAWLPVFALVLVLWAVWHWRATLGGYIVWGLGHFVSTLLPVLGFLPFGYHAHSFVADRFVYLACVGPFVMLVLTAERAWRAAHRSRASQLILPTAGVAVGVALAVLTRRQLPVWQSSATLWSYTVARNPASWAAQGNYGSVLYFQQQYAQALAHWRACLRLEPESLSVHLKIALALRALGDLDGAVAYLRRAAEEHADYPDLRAALADGLAAQGQVAEAVQMLREIGWTYQDKCALAYERLAWIYATWPTPTWRDGKEAVRLAECAVGLTQSQLAQPLDTLAAAYAATGRFPQAVEVAENALRLAQRDGDQVLAAEIQRRLTGYRAGRPHRQGSGP
jgi:tetratricopeptide (TPR) repeat protein